MRQIVLDTETTGLEVTQNHRIIEIGAVKNSLQTNPDSLKYQMNF